MKGFLLWEDDLSKFFVHQNFNVVLQMSVHHAIIPAEAAVKYDFFRYAKKKQINV